jgi:AraC-like DNA-binding protein
MNNRLFYNVSDNPMHATTQCTLSHEFYLPLLPYTAMAHNDQIERAIAHLKVQNSPNIAATAREFEVSRPTLSRRFFRKPTSCGQATATHHMKLSPVQEKVLIAYINKLSNYGLPSTLQIVRNLAKELLKSDVGMY